VSVPRREGLSGPGETVAQHAAGVPGETAIFRKFGEKDERLRSEFRFSTGVRSVAWNKSSERCVNCVSSAVALRKRELRTSEWRTGVMRTCGAFPTASPKDTLAGVFEHMRRAARMRKSLRISERLAPRFKRSEFPFCVSGKA
jgi:hypothetical protein